MKIDTISVELGVVESKNDIQENQKTKLLSKLRILGFDLINDKKSRTIEKIKTLIIDLVQHNSNDLKLNLSEYLSQQLNQDYNTISNLFSEIENSTIEKYFINQKIEKVKELLIYDEMTLTEIAYLLNYSSVGYLSNQFKKVTGFPPTYFKQLKDKKRKQIEDL